MTFSNENKFELCSNGREYALRPVQETIPDIQ